jgi:hypothetical protein
MQLYFISPYYYRTYSVSRPPDPPAISPVTIRVYINGYIDPII